jgi:hypothetical protein
MAHQHLVILLLSIMAGLLVPDQTMAWAEAGSSASKILWLVCPRWTTVWFDLTMVWFDGMVRSDVWSVGT